MFNSVIILLKCTSRVVRRIYIDTLDLTGKLLLQCFQRQQIISEDQSIIENAIQSTEHLITESWALKRAMEAGQTSIVAGVYDVKSGLFQLLT